MRVRKGRYLFVVAIAVLRLAGCGAKPSSPSAGENYGPVTLTGPAIPAVPNPKPNTRPLSLPSHASR